MNIRHAISLWQLQQQTTIIFELFYFLSDKNINLHLTSCSLSFSAIPALMVNISSISFLSFSISSRTFWGSDERWLEAINSLIRASVRHSTIKNNYKYFFSIQRNKFKSFTLFCYLFEFWLSDANWNQCSCQKGDIISDSSKGYELTSFRSKFFYCLCIWQSS